MSHLKVIISGGGTGGHIFPALSIAGEIKRRLPDADILFVGALGKMEMERVPAAGYRIVGLPVMGMPRTLSLRFFRFFWMLLKSIRKAHTIVASFRPDVVVGVGGFASGPVLRAAAQKGIPAILQEQNSYAGVTNKLLAKKVRRICVAYPAMERYFPKEKIVETGNPVRSSLEVTIDKMKAFEKFGLRSDLPVLLVVGGSLGARSLNESVMANLDLIASSRVQVIWQTGKIYYREMLDRLDGYHPANLKVLEFLIEMDLAYGVATLVVSRAGAGTISELCLLGKASVLVPSPNVAEDHQTRNAQALVDRQAAIMIKDTEVSEKLFPAALELINNTAKREELQRHCRAMAKPGATSDIVDVIFNEISL